VQALHNCLHSQQRPCAGSTTDFWLEGGLFSHGTVAPVSSFSSSNVVLQSSGSHVLRPRVAQVSARLNIQHCSCKKLF
jgi:hypothetical protein